MDTMKKMGFIQYINNVSYLFLKLNLDHIVEFKYLSIPKIKEFENMYVKFIDSEEPKIDLDQYHIRFPMGRWIIFSCLLLFIEYLDFVLRCNIFFTNVNFYTDHIYF